MKIVSINAIEIFDSRGFPTIETEVLCENGIIGIASVPSGASTGAKEAFELRDGDKKYCHGRGVLNAVNNVNEILGTELLEISVADQAVIDNLMCELDGTENKSKLGANAILSVSLAVADAAAKSYNMQLHEYLGGINGNETPCPMMNILNGGKHADNALDIQEFMIMPVKADNFKHALVKGSEVFHVLKKILQERGLSTNVGDEGGFAPNIGSTEEAMDLLMTAIEKAGYRAGEDFVIALDCAASEFYNTATKKYELKGENLQLTSEELIEKYADLVAKYPIFSIEDPLHEDDFFGFELMTKKLGHKLQIVGDDLFCTNPALLKSGIDSGLANALLVKPNQIGTLTECLNAIKIAKNAGYGTIISHRSGETEDIKISHIAVAINAGQIKTGSMCRTDRIAKYNELIRIESRAVGISYAGGRILEKFTNFRSK